MPAAAQVAPSETLVPATTQYWVSIPNVDETVKNWNKTELGKLMDDPVMKPLRDDLDRQTTKRREEMGNDLGIDWEDLKAMAGGELCMALIHPAKRMPSRNILTDITGRAKEAAAVRTKLHATQAKAAAEKSALTVGDVTINVFKKEGKTRLAEFIRGNLFCIARDETVATDILTRHLKGGKDNLASFVPYVMVTKRVAADTATLGKADETPHARWFVQPIGFGEARRLLDPNRDPDALDMLDVAKKSGFEGVQGIGGLTRLRVGGSYDMLNRAAVYAPKPWEKSLPMLSMINDDDRRLSADGEWWVPKQLASFSVCNLELLTAFDHFGPFFDEAVAGGKKDAWKKAVNRIKTDPLGPKVDLRADIMRHLVAKGPTGHETARCIMINDNRLPVEPDSERQLIAVQIQPPQAEPALVAALTKYFKPDKTVQFRPKWVGPYDVWDSEPEPKKDEKKKPPALKVEGGGKAVALPAPAPPPREHEAICVADGWFFYASHISQMGELLNHMVTKKANPKTVLSLENDVDYQEVAKQLGTQQKLRGWPQGCLRRFDRTEEGVLVNYELTRTGRLNQSDRNTAKLLLDLLDPGGDGTKPFDMSKLPPHQAVRRYFQPSGTLVHNETNGEYPAMKEWCGWFVVNFTLQR
jgi:hypothetical protein